MARTTPSKTASALADRIIRQIESCESGEDCTLTFGRDRTLQLSNLGKVFFRKEGYTKGDLVRYYTTIAHLILPTINDRPLVLKRFPNGISAKSFYQQNAGYDVPKAVRVETLEIEGESQRRFIGGDLITLLYTIQLGAISVDPWHSRVQSIEYADYSILDLDPGTRAPFQRVVETALWVKEVLDDFGLHGALKTSGASGLHVYLPLPGRTPNDSATLLAQIVATEVATRHPKETTIARAVSDRKTTAVYVDYLQNIRGKTVAGPYCVRAKPGATVSTPLKWDELTDTLDPRDFTIETVLARFKQAGDLWKAAMRKPNSLRNVLK